MLINQKPSVAGDQANEARSETLSMQVYLAIRDRIFRGEWLPGTRLTLRGLALELGTSVQPVRDAVGKLTVERALILRPNHSLLLPPIERSDMEEIFSMRNILEGEAARLCASAMHEADFDRLEATIRATRQVYIMGTVITDRVAAIQSVAKALAERSGSSILAEQIVNLRTRTAPFYAAALTKDDMVDSEFVTFTIRIQEEFLRALRRRDGVAAAEIRKVDLYTFQHHIYRLLSLEN
jgi:DNA-binding GntR family transcriptional regulator